MEKSNRSLIRRLPKWPTLLQRPQGERLSTVIAIVASIYGLVRLFAGLLHRVLPTRILDTMPELVSDIHNTHAIASGAVLFLLGFGLLKRRRSHYLASLAVLVASAVSAVIIGVTPWFWALSLLLVLALLPLRTFFVEKARLFPTPTQTVGLAALSLAVAYSVVGSYLMRDQFTNMRTWGDAAYFAITTLTTVNYGDIVPKAGSQGARFFATSVVVVGISMFVTAVSLIVVPFLERQAKGVMQVMERFRKRPLRDHVIVCFYTQVGQSVAAELRAKGASFLIIEPSEPIAEAIQGRGDRVLQADPTEETTLLSANILEARAIVACSDHDADNALTTLIAHEVRTSGRNRGLRIIARIEQEQGVSKLRAAGADAVISPSTLGGRMMGKLAAGETEEQVRQEIQSTLISHGV